MSNPVARDSKRPHPNFVPVDTQARIGKILAQARQAKGLSETEIANKLRLSIANVQAIEQDQYEKIPRVFIRGYIKNYAHIVGVDESELPPLPVVEPPTAQAIHIPQKRSSSAYEIRSNHVVVQAVTWSIVLGLIGLLWLWSQGQLMWENSATTPDTTTTTVPAVAQSEVPVKVNPPPTVKLPVEQGVVSAPKPGPTTVPVMSNQAPTTSANTPTPNTAIPTVVTTNTITSIQPSMLPALQTAPPEMPVNEAVIKPQVVIEFVGKSTVNIRDSKKQFKLTGKMQKGDKHVFEGVPPYTIKLSNTQAVRITVGGRPFDLKRHSKRGVADFVLDPEHLN